MTNQQGVVSDTFLFNELKMPRFGFDQAVTLFIWILHISTDAVRGDVTPTHDAVTSIGSPQGWSSICTNNKKITENKTYISFSCDVGAYDTWSLFQFRNWSSRLTDDIYVVLDVQCHAGGRICLPWPYRAHHLHTLRIRDCINFCYYDEYKEPEVIEAIPDTLWVFEGYDVTVEAGIMDIITLDVRSQPPAIECGPLLLETYIYRSSKTIFTGEILPSDDNITDVFTDMVVASDDLPHICRYVNMKVYDVSQRVNASAHFLYTILVNSRFPELRVLNLSSTEQQTFPTLLQVWRRRFPKLLHLDLSRNNISRFDLRDLSFSSQSVGTIDLSYNQLRTIGFHEIKSIKLVQKAVINIRHNPFECNCAMTNFSTFLQTYGSPIEAKLIGNYSYLWNLECVSPARFRGMRIALLTKELLCDTDVTPYVAQITALAIVVVFLLIVIVLMARYRKEIRILAFTRLHIMLPCHPTEDSSKKKYDAFVAYSHMDTTWVVKTLLPRLENGSDCNFRLCLHQRDFEVGAAIADNIVQSVEASRHTILILSKKFLESEWCLMEFRTAFHQSLIEKKRHLILVLLEDIPTRDLEPDLRSCMQTWTYLHISDKLFWDRIVYALTDKSKSSWGVIHHKKNNEEEESEKLQNGDIVIQKF